jgi:hypothetical protein
LNRQCFVHICIRKISCATLQCSASVQHNMELNTLRNVKLYWSLLSPLKKQNITSPTAA